MSDSEFYQRPWWLSFLDKTNLTVTALTALVLLASRSMRVAYFCIGAVLCAMTAKILKRLIKQSRPMSTAAQLPPGITPFGMPSTHSAVIAYYAAYIALACAFVPVQGNMSPNVLIMSRLVPPVIASPWAALVVMSRVWLGHHTWPQVLVGSGCGLGFALIWFTLEDVGRR